MSQENNGAAQDTPKTAADSEKSEQQIQDKIYPPKPEGESSDKKPADEVKDPPKPADKSEEKKPEPPKEGEKKPEETPQVPEKYELKLPEKSLLSKERLENTATYSKEKKLTNEQAQELLNRESDAVKSFSEAQHKSFETNQESWKSTCQNDKEIGGERFQENCELARRVVDKYGTEQLKDELNKTGFGNHPEVLRVFARIGKAMKSDSLVLPGSMPSEKRSIEDVFYGSSGKKQ